MQFEPFDLLYRVEEGHARARIDLSSSDMPTQPLADYGGLEGRTLASSPPGGGNELRSELAKLFGGDAEDYIVTAGASEANFAVCAALLRPGDQVLVERPVYQPLRSVPKGLGANVHDLVRKEENGFSVTEGEIEAALPQGLRLLVLSNLHNPTGAAFDAATIHRIADLAAACGFHVLMDEIFRELAFGPEVPTIGGLNDHVVVTSSVSKFYGAGGLRIGWVRAAPEIRTKVRAVLDYLSVGTSSLSEAVALSLLRNRPKTVARNRRLIQEGRKVAAEWAQSSPDVTWYDMPAHLTYPRVGGNTAVLAERLLEKYGTFIAPGETFGLAGHFRLNIGIGAERLAEGLARVSKARRGE